ncbi:M56 family metallopeptidase [Aquimarina longa]|uniref:M56 family metallopeptidase n=1 Tax=Aquimarina longa TaxID=1080221 RepID=UPI0009ECA2C8|nr:M56 family metallopeptidase [Aquimarina longa]
MIVYILKSSLCLLLLWGFYTLFLEREQMHHFKRFYLLFSLVFAYTIPLITITYTTDATISSDEFQHPITYVTQTDRIQPEEASINYILILLWTVYGIGVLVFAIRFIKNISNLIKKVRRNENLKEPSHINVLLSNTIIPHTFLKYIFVPKKEFQKKVIPQEVLLHEKTHVQQKHTLDILLVEVLQILFWFNPLWFLIKKSIRLNHEFLADQKVLKQQFSIPHYMNILVNYPSSTHQTVLTSPINYSLTKKRILMMSQQFSRTRAAARLLLLLPILLGCMLLFNNKIIAQQKNPQYTEPVTQTDSDKQIKIRIKNKQITVNGTATKFSDFVSTIDDMTKQWDDDELSRFQFDIQIMNSEDAFVQQLNEAYRKTRLYKANPSGHDLIPPPPPLPETLKMKKEETSHTSTPLALKVKKDKKNVIPSPPMPTAPLAPFSHSVDIDMEDIENEVALATIETEQEIAMTMAEEVEEIKAMAMEKAKEARMIAMEEAEEARMIAMEEAREVREVREAILEEVHRVQERSHEIREEAMREIERSRAEIEKHREIHIRKAKEHAKRVQKHAKYTASKARKKAEKARRKAIEKARKIHDIARKEAMSARKEVRKAILEAKKEQKKNSREN